MLAPHVAISGAGPAGLLVAILLSQAGILVTVLEKSLVADPWSSRSYSINLNSRGLSALDNAGVLQDVQAVGMPRHCVVLESSDGEQQIIPRNPPHYAVTRPALVECLEAIVANQHPEHVTIKRGVGVKSVIQCTEDNNNDKSLFLKVALDDGSTLTCTHVIGADGKWSAVRNAIPDLKGQFTVQKEPAFGIFITPCVNPERWRPDATTVFRPKDANAKYYILAAPLPAQKCSITAVCYEEIKNQHPWCFPRDDKDQEAASSDSWEAEYGESPSSSESFAEQFATMIKEDLPLLYKEVHGFESLSTARPNRAASWLKPLVENPLYCDQTGRVALIGDSAHAMTAAIGEGCNCALESAVLLKELLQKQRSKEEGSTVTVEMLTEAFLEYGRRRPSEVIPIQTMSAERNRHKAPTGIPPK